MATLNTRHKSVLVNEIIDLIPIQSPKIIVDGTINGGGHSFEMGQILTDKDLIIGIDKDINALKRAESNLKNIKCQLKLIQGSFSDLDILLGKNNIKEIDFLLLDLGWSQNQIDDSERGFSFMVDGPLDMRFDQNKELPTAADLINSLNEQDLTFIIKELGEERFAKKIAKAIVKRRNEKEFNRTIELANFISEILPKGKIHPATKTFQALRIAVNNELSTLKLGLEKGFNLLKPNGVMAVISFHSLEDRIVKQYFVEQKNLSLTNSISKKPIMASKEELNDNPRARSAKLRVLSKK